MFSTIKDDLKEFINSAKSLDRYTVIVFLSVAVLQTISYYYTSRRFFRYTFYYSSFDANSQRDLYEYLYWFAGDFISFFILPLLIIFFLLKDRPVNFGLKWGDYRTGLKYTAIFLAVMIPLVWIASSMSSFAVKYPHLKEAKESWLLFLIFESGMLVYMFAWEFIWRGFMLFGLEKRFGYYAVLMQMIPFLILHNGKPPLETFGAILGGIALGALALKTRSFIYCVIIHFGVMFSIDLISVLRNRAGEFGIGFEAILKVFFGT